MWYCWVGAYTLPGPTSRSMLVEDGEVDVAGVGAADVVGIRAVDAVGVRAADVVGVLSGVSIIAADAGGVATRIDGS